MSAKKYIVLIGVLVLLFVVFKLLSPFDSVNMEGVDIGEIGKEFAITVKTTDIRDFNYLNSNEHIQLLSSSEIEKLKKYMKDENLKLKEGKYKLNQTDKYQDLVNKLEFEK